MPEIRKAGIRELTDEECIEATRLVYTPNAAGERSVVRTVGAAAKILANQRKKRGDTRKVSPDTVKRGIKYAIENGLIVVEPRQRSEQELPEQCPELEEALLRVLPIDDAVVLKCPDDSLISQDAYESLQRKLGHALARYMALEANREFSRTKPRSWGLGGGRAVRSFARRLESFSPPHRWPGQRVYSFGGSLEGDAIWVDGVPALLGSDSAAAAFASAFDDKVDTRRVLAPLIAETPEQVSRVRGKPRPFDEFGRDERPSVAIVATRFGALEVPFFNGMSSPATAPKRAKELMDVALSWANRQPDAVGRNNGYCPIANVVAVPFLVPNLHKIPNTQEPPTQVKEALKELEALFVSGGMAGLRRADQVILIGGGFGHAATIDYLTTTEYQGKVRLVVTSSGSAERIRDWHSGRR